MSKWVMTDHYHRIVEEIDDIEDLEKEIKNLERIILQASMILKTAREYLAQMRGQDDDKR